MLYYLEATIITWSKNIGDMVELDETIVEIATRLKYNEFVQINQ